MINVANSSDIQVRLCAGIDVIVGCCLYISDPQRWQKVGFDHPPTAETHADISYVPAERPTRLVESYVARLAAQSL